MIHKCIDAEIISDDGQLTLDIRRFKRLIFDYNTGVRYYLACKEFMGKNDVNADNLGRITRLKNLALYHAKRNI